MKGLFKVFDINKPACEVLSFELRHAGKRIKKPISSICELDGQSSSNFLALGCHSGDQVYLVDQRSLKRAAMHTVQVPASTGVSCMKSFGELLFVGCRRRDNISAFDMRWLSTPILQVNFARSTSAEGAKSYSNQRYYFDIDEGSGTLLAGGPEGNILGYNLGMNE